MPTDCSDCTRLQHELGNAITVHIKLLGQSQIAAMQFDSRLLATLEPLVLAAEERRAKAKANFKEHEATHSRNDNDHSCDQLNESPD
jgi:hypothetical protein